MSDLEHRLVKMLKLTYEFEQELLDVEGSEELSLSVDDDFSRGLSWDGKEWLHNLFEKTQS